jgi:plastocyanin
VLVLAGIATGNKIGLAAVAVTFIAFALLASFVAPRRWPDFPGRQGLSVFVIVSVVLFAAQLTAIVVLAVEHEAKAAGNEGAANAKTIDVQETEFKIELPSLTALGQGTYTFVVHNAGQAEHDLVVEGPKLTGGKRTPIIPPGGEAKLTVVLGAGSYTLYCSVDSHRQAGMVAKLAVG